MRSNIKLLVRLIVLLYKEMAIPEGLTTKQQIEHTKKAVTLLVGKEVNLVRDSDDPVVRTVSRRITLFLTSSSL